MQILRSRTDRLRTFVSLGPFFCPCEFSDVSIWIGKRYTCVKKQKAHPGVPGRNRFSVHHLLIDCLPEV